MLGKKRGVSDVNSDFKTYLEFIGVTDPIRKKIEDIYNIWMKIDPNFKVENIFVSDYTEKKSGIRRYDRVHFFTDNLVLATEDFQNEYVLELIPIKNRLKLMEIRIDEYDFNKAFPKSKMSLIVETDSDSHIQCRASQKNCDYLKIIIDKYIKPNLKL